MRALNVLLAAIVTASISLTPVLGSSSAFAEGAARGGARQGRMMDKLNLTPEQKQQMQGIHKETQAKMKPLQAEMRQAQQERKSLMARDASTQELQSNFDKIQGIKNRIAQVNFDRMTKIRNVLTPEQRAQMDKMMRERKNNRAERQGNQRQNRSQGQGGQWNMNGDR